MNQRAYKIALCQMTVTDDKDENLAKAAEMIRAAAAAGARVVCLPEIWNAPYDVKRMRSYAEPADGSSSKFMAHLARELQIYLVGGSIPEIDGAAMYNTSFVFDPAGNCIARHRKVHLFDVDVENGISHKESDLFGAGDGPTIFDTEFGKIGLAVCFDIRFPAMFIEMAAKGCHLIFLPAAFTLTTGAAHWETLIRSRALDNQLFFAACGPARNPDAIYASWGHTTVATPWGDKAGCADERESIVYAVIDPDYANKIRREIPIGNPPAL
ncbi:MAG: carbon-nitrogen hydrolase family protein [Clostridiales Family XIII bacterium]|jgi:predicted amidohydrolase|nr:carbon-nitrogen hydrolase family protein [Clostridiales Family XIII bacterium]